MPVVPHLESLEAVAGQSRTKEHFSFAYRDFLDGFYANPDPAGLTVEPRLLRDTLHDKGYADAFLAALAEHLACHHHFPIPSWCRTPERSLPEPVFAFKTYEGRMFLLVESPTAFRVRNIFISADALTRV
jgi:hypothetical protein